MAIEISVLNNGIRVVSDYMENLETVSVGIWVNTGSRNEAEVENGISHFIEHMMFKGTANRSPADIAVEIENVGGIINAYTSRDSTAFYAKVLKNDVALALDVISDMLNNHSFAEDEFAREKEVVIQEIKQAFDDPEDCVFDLFQKASYPEQAIGRTILGPESNIRKMKTDDLRAYVNKHYCGANIIVAAAGNIRHQDLLKLAEDFLGDRVKGETNKPVKSEYVGMDLRQSKDLEQAQLLLGFNGQAYAGDDYYQLAVFSSLFRGGLSSRLFQEVREKRGLVYSVYSFSSSYDDSGVFGIYAGTGKDDSKKLIPVVCDEIKKILDDGVSEDETKRAKAQLKASILMSMENSSSRCERMAQQLMVFDKIIDTEEVVAKIDAVTPADILASSRRMFSSKLCFAGYGAIDAVPNYNEITKLI